jgi:hypothetical protein
VLSCAGSVAQGTGKRTHRSTAAAHFVTGGVVRAQFEPVKFLST